MVGGVSNDRYVQCVTSEVNNYTCGQCVTDGVNV